MTIKLTKKQLLLYDFIKDFTEKNNYSPTYREIMAGMGLKSVSAVAEHVDNLVEKGVIIKSPGAARSLTVVEYRHPETVALFKEALETAEESDKDTLKKAAEILGLDLD